MDKVDASSNTYGDRLTKCRRTNIRCNLCGQLFTSERALDKHRRTAAYCSASGERVKEHACSRCGKAFVRRDTLERHEREVHHGQNGSTASNGEYFAAEGKPQIHLDDIRLDMRPWDYMYASQPISAGRPLPGTSDELGSRHVGQSDSASTKEHCAPFPATPGHQEYRPRDFITENNDLFLSADQVAENLAVAVDGLQYKSNVDSWFQHPTSTLR